MTEPLMPPEGLPTLVELHFLGMRPPEKGECYYFCWDSRQSWEGPYFATEAINERGCQYATYSMVTFPTCTSTPR